MSASRPHRQERDPSPNPAGFGPGQVGECGGEPVAPRERHLVGCLELRDARSSTAKCVRQIFLAKTTLDPGHAEQHTRYRMQVAYDSHGQVAPNPAIFNGGGVAWRAWAQDEVDRIQRASESFSG